MGRVRIVASLAAAAVVTALCFATCGEERVPGSTAVDGPPGDAASDASGVDGAGAPTARRPVARMPRPAAAPPEAPASAEAAEPSDTPETGDPVRFEIVVPEGTPLSAVTVRAWQLRWSDETGTRRFSSLGRERSLGPDGVVTVLAPDREGTVVLAYASAPGLHSTGEPAHAQNGWTARILLGRGIDVEGAVTDAEGKSVAGAEVRLVPLGRVRHSPWSNDIRAWAAEGVFEHYGASVRTDAHGRYRIRGVPTAREGRAQVEHVPIVRDAARRVVEGESLTAGPEPATFVRDLRMGAEEYVAEAAPERRTLRVTGRVVEDAEGSPAIGQASVVLVAGARGRFASESTMTDAESGAFVLELRWDATVVPEEPEIVVRADGFRTHRAPAAAAAADDDDGLEIRMKRDVRGAALGTVNGRAVDEGAKVSGRIVLQCRREDATIERLTVFADAEGRFRLAGLEPGWWEFSAGWSDRTVVRVVAGEEVGAVVRAIRWEADPEPWTPEEEAALRVAEAEFFETMRAMGPPSDEAPGEADDASLVRHNEALRRVQELRARRERRVQRRPVRLRGIAAGGRAWVRATAEGWLERGETWTADVRSAEASFAALAVGDWDFVVTRAGETEDRFRLTVPAGTDEVVLDAALGAR